MAANRPKSPARKAPARKTTDRTSARQGAKRTASKAGGEPAPFLERTPILEWVTAALGLVGALGAIGFLTWEGLHADPRPPRLAAAAQEVTATPQGFTVEVEVANHGRTTASAVEVEGVVPAAGAEAEETVALTFDYVPGRGRREGSMTFERDPRGLQLRVKGQVAP